MILYHSTFIDNIDNILSEGLIPNKKLNWIDWSEEGYVYFSDNPNLSLQWMRDAINENNLDIEDIVILYVDIPDDKLEVDFKNFTGTDYKFKGKISPEYIKIFAEYEPIMQGELVNNFKKISMKKTADNEPINVLGEGSDAIVDENPPADLPEGDENMGGDFFGGDIGGGGGDMGGAMGEEPLGGMGQPKAPVEDKIDWDKLKINKSPDLDEAIERYYDEMSDVNFSRLT